MKKNLVFRIRSSPNFGKHGICLNLNKFGMAVISILEPNSPSEKSGLKINDIILRVNDENVFGERLEKINNLINKSYRNGFIKLEISRETSSMPWKPVTPYIDPKQPKMVTINRKKKYENIGFELKFIENENRYFAINVHKDLVAYKSGLRDFDNILEINGVKIYQMDNESVNDFVYSLDNEIDLLLISDLGEYYRIVENEAQKFKPNLKIRAKKEIFCKF